jgi:ATP-binding cassette subfamily B protein
VKSFFQQHDQIDCGPACLSMITSEYGRQYSLQQLRDECYITREGVSLFGIIEAAKKMGFKTFSAKLTTEQLKEDKEILPCILHWNQNHFVVLYKICSPLFRRAVKGEAFFIADPAHGLVKLSEERFKKNWVSDEDKGVALFLEPTEEFYKLQPPASDKVKIKFLFKYLTPYTKQLSLMFLLLLFGSAITLIFPFLTQNLIDKGIHAKNIDTITTILLAQLALYIGSITMSILRNWLLLFVGTKLSIKIISDFLKKMLQLPIKFFDTKTMGDFNQRIRDNERIESFLSSQSLLTFFSILTFSVFFGVLWYYNIKILLVYITLTVLSIIWSYYWLQKRRQLDYLRFQQRSENQESIYEMLNGVTEMKLNQFEDFKRNKWEEIQHKLFNINIRILKLDQLQLSGFEFLNQIKNILVTFLAASFVVHDKMTLGALLSVSYIVGEMNSPVNQLVNFFRSLQDAKISLERLNEIQNHPVEEDAQSQKIIKKNNNGEIVLENVSFQYEGPHSPFVLKDICLQIPNGKITAIVGTSGSGKTTLMKLLLKFYTPVEGSIFYNGTNIIELSPKELRKSCGVVMQDGYIFSDAIERNIATGDEEINKEKLHHAVEIANIKTFIENLPLYYKTKIGVSGIGISSGQRQRILIARAIYKNPDYIFLDEATSALDAENEKVIHDNLQTLFKGKTVVIIAHRLSTVKNADQIVVLENGQIVETGNHEALTKQKGKYFELVKNQLELGN